MSKKKPIIAVVSIMKDEALFLPRWAASCKDADYRILLDTGSSDKSIAVAKKLGVTVHKKIITPWHFANARNYLLDLIPEDVDWIISLDCDEILGEGWRAHLEKVPNDGSINRPRYTYTWNWKQRFYLADGSDNVEKTMNTPNNEGLVYKGDKIVRRFSHRFVNAVHEVNVTREGVQELQGFTDLCIYHFADDSKSRSSYLPLLLLDVEENPDSDRQAYYLARELMYVGRVEESVAMFKKHLAMPNAWNAEKAFGMRYIAQMVPAEAEKWLLRACAEYPGGREPWVQLAQHYHNIGYWLGCYYAAERALSITDRNSAYLTEAHSWGFIAHDLLALATAKLGMTDIAIQSGKNAITYAPNDVRLKDNLYFYKREKAKVDVIIPTKSNIEGLKLLVSQLKLDSAVGRIVVIADSDEAYDNLHFLSNDIIKVCLPASVSNINVMWNLGMKILGSKNYICIVNDDVDLSPNCVTNMLDVMLKDETIGLICPNYSTTPNPNDYVDVEATEVTSPRHDGYGGFAGFCFMIAKDLVPFWHFDESLHWLGTDNLILDWCRRVAQRKAIITHKARCVHESHKTFYDNPPADWTEQRLRDGNRYANIVADIEESESYSG